MTRKPAVTVIQAYEWFLAIQEIERCDAVIRQYEEMGISGTPHDLEHRGMREMAREKAAILRRGWR